MTDSDGVIESSSSSYRNYEEEARELVQRIITQALIGIQAELELEARNKLLEVLPDVQTPPLDWPTGENFTVLKGEEAIDRLVKTWPVVDSWKYCIDYLHEKDNLHCYVVKYSQPTRRKPVPRATASVFFYLLPYSKECPVLVLYVVEGQSLTHNPADDNFHEVWLRNVIENKTVITEASKHT